WSISTSSGSTASGSMERRKSSCLPLTAAVTMPPPAVASYSLLSISCCILSISCCIFCACLIIFMFMPPMGMPRYPPLAIVQNSLVFNVDNIGMLLPEGEKRTHGVIFPAGNLLAALNAAHPHRPSQELGGNPRRRLHHLGAVHHFFCEVALRHQ